jgi:hypothetical protein
MPHGEPIAWSPHDLTIRPAHPDDLALLTRALGEAAYFTDRLTRQKADRGELLVALRADRPVGHVYLGWEPPDEPEIREHLPGVPVLQRLEVHGPYRRIALAVEESNTDATPLYVQLGWRKWQYGQVACQAPDSDAIEICDLLTKALGRQS